MTSSNDRLFQVQGSGFVAGFVVRGNAYTEWVAECAPILKKHILGTNLGRALEYCSKKNWNVSEIKTNP